MNNTSATNGAENRPVIQKRMSATGTKLKTRTIGWKNFTYDVMVKKKVDEGNGKTVTKKVERRLLNNVSGYVASGEFLAIMGPSGCGKTTLLDGLAGRLGSGTINGEVLIDGSPQDDKFKHYSSYVAQEDSLMGVFTVLETLEYAASLKLPGSISQDQKKERVHNLIENVGLTDAASTKVGDLFFKGLSGGQKRRLTIATELIANPSILLLDEPTSGLDSASALGIVSLLQTLCTKGHTIAMTVHQPSSEVWACFDKFLLLSKGITMYFGPASGAVSYFSHAGHECPQYSNPSDFFLTLVNTDFEGHADLDKLSSAFREHSLHQGIMDDIARAEERSRNKRGGASGPNSWARKGKVSADIEDGDKAAANGATVEPGGMDGDDSSSSSGGEEERPPTMVGFGKDHNTPSFKTSFLHQFLVLSHRNFLNNARNPGIYIVRLFMYTMLSLMVGLMYLGLGTRKDQEDIVSRVSLLFYVAAFLVFMSVAVLPFFIQERAVFLRERSNGWYAVGPYVLSNGLCALPGLFLIALVSTILVVLPAGINGFGIFLVDLFLSLVVAESFMSLMASLVPHYIIGIALAAGVYGFFMLCEGFLIVFNDIPPWFIWGYYIAFHTYSFRVFMYNEFKDIDNFSATAQFQTGKELLAFYDMEDVKVGQDMGILVAYAVAFQLIFYYILYKYHTGKR